MSCTSGYFAYLGKSGAETTKKDAYPARIGAQPKKSKQINFDAETTQKGADQQRFEAELIKIGAQPKEKGA